jgi:hypothetical protein
MLTTLSKLEYLDETKAQIKTALNQFNAGITDEDTFRSYVSKIDDIYDGWPKVTGSGTSVTITNTRKAKMNIDLKGNTVIEPIYDDASQVNKDGRFWLLEEGKWELYQFNK